MTENSIDIDPEFKLEAIDLLDAAEDALLELESGSDFEEAYQIIFRSFHSLKGAAGMFEITSLEKTIHFMEDLLEKQKTKQKLEGHYIQYFLQGLDAARDILDGKNPNFELKDPEGAQEKKENAKVVDAPRVKKKKSDIDKGLVFVVDDEQDILDIIQGELEDEGYHVITFLSAQEALKQLPKSSPDLVITDINMPKMNGLELLEQVQKLRAQLPLIIVSGYVTKEICIEALSNGVSGIIEKPFNADQLLKMCHHNIQKYRTFKLLERSVNYMVYQFSDLDEFLEKSNKTSLRDTLKAELKTIMKETKKLKNP